jgi:phosphatidylserine/phosphatidylglycerophosphate/cardiolipin synthase-like enzyme
MKYIFSVCGGLISLCSFGQIINSGVNVSDITQSGITLSWTNSIQANSYVRYGFTPNLELGVLSGGITLSPSIAISGAGPAQLIYAQAVAESGATISQTDTLVFITSSQSSGKMTAYFNRPVDHSYASGAANQAVHLSNLIDDTLIEFIGRATETLDITIYNVGAPSGSLSNIVGAINSAYLSGVQVRIIYNEDTGNAGLDNLHANIPRLISPVPQFPDGFGLMHNKFVVVDARSSNHLKPQVWTGSTNWTTQQINTDANNVIIVQDKSLAIAYTLEFEEMWGGSGMSPNPALSRFGPNKKDNTPHVFNVNGKRIECYFSPSDGTNSRINQAINDASDDLIINTMLITRSDLASTINFRHFSGTKVGVLVNHENETTQFATLRNVLKGRIADYSTTTGVLHHKLLIGNAYSGNNPFVLTGSHNWSSSAEQRNDENTLIIYDAAIANQYMQEFMGRYVPVVTPSAVDDYANAVQNYPWTLDVTENDQFFKTADPYVVVLTQPTKGVAVAHDDLFISYTADAGYQGTDSLQYAVCNRAFLDYCDTAWVFYNVALTGLDEWSADTRVYPNPASEFVTIQANGLTRFSLFSAEGRLILEEQTNSGATIHSISLSSISKGVYYLHLIHETGITANHKIIVNSK